jgi:splicing factor 3A subunit 1
MAGMPAALGLGPPMVDMSGLLGADMDEPAFKRMRAGGAPPTGGEEFLIPEAEFLATNANPVSFSVMCPNITDKSEWRLNGQVIPMTLPLQDTLTVVKARLHEATGMPPGKQKLQLDTLFLKDANSLAYYNVRHGATISLQIKERGGRKK